MKKGDLTLAVYAPILDPSARFWFNFGSVSSWRRSVRALGGAWSGSFEVPAEFRADIVPMFYELLGAHLVELSPAGETWNGLIYELELSYNGIVRRRSLDLIVNAVDVFYSSAGEVVDLGFSTEAESIARYGRREERLSFDEIPSGTATALQSRYLAGNSWPWARPVSVGDPSVPVLLVRACGYVFTANWLFVVAGDGTEHDLDHWISAVVGSAEGLSSDHGGSVSGAADCQFLTAGTIDSNTLQAVERIDGDLRPWSLISQLAGLGDSSGDPWLAWVDKDRRLNYRAADLDPSYFITQGGIYRANDGKPAEPFELSPGTFRDLSYPIRRAEPGSMFSDTRDLWVDEIEIDSAGAVTLKTALFDDAAIVAAQLEQKGRNAQALGER